MLQPLMIRVNRSSLACIASPSSSVPDRLLGGGLDRSLLVLRRSDGGVGEALYVFEEGEVEFVGGVFGNEPRRARGRGWFRSFCGNRCRSEQFVTVPWMHRST